MSKIDVINNASGAPAAIGTYSQAARAGDMVYLSGQIGIDPETSELVDGFEAQTRMVFSNVRSLCVAAGGSLGNAVKLNVYLEDMDNFAKFNEIAVAELSEPYPARALIQAAALPKGALVEIEAILHLPG